MSKKTELKKLFTDMSYNFHKAFSYIQSGDKYIYKSYMADASLKIGQIEYLLGNKEAEFRAKVELKTAPYGCTEDKMNAYIDNLDFTSYQSCIGISKLAYLEVTDEMF
jgi:hypothetical protein